MMEEERFWSADVSELVQGYVLREGIFYCLVCGAPFPKGEVFPKGGHFFDAETMAALHLKEAHGSMLDDLLTLPAGTLGLSPAQLELVRLLAQGKKDKEIAAQQGVALSTVRNHRFKLREKEKQARLFLALMELLRAGGQAEEIPFCSPHRTAAMVDARYAVTREERDAILSSCFDSQGALLRFPTKEKKKLVVLRAIADHFKPGRQYTEVEINRILGRIYEDYPYLRRLLIEYGFLERTHSGSSYWRKE